MRTQTPNYGYRNHFDGIGFSGNFPVSTSKRKQEEDLNEENFGDDDIEEEMDDDDFDDDDFNDESDDFDDDADDEY